jgi:hypothetical protein
MNLTLMKHFLLAIGIISLTLTNSSAEESTADVAADEIILNPVVVDGTPADALKFDPIVPSTKGSTTQKASNGGIAKDIANQLPFHLSDNMKPGNVVNMSGNVRTAEEFDVNVLGIPLNAPQGGGFNLTSFPQYMWSGFNFQLGPSMGAYDPRGIAGSLSLKLWTQDALLTEEKETRITVFDSTNKISQHSVGVDTGKGFAINVGTGRGQVSGPAGSMSARLFENNRLKTKLHLIATNQKTENFQSERSTQATADYTVMRFIPILQADADLSSKIIFKSSFFWDHTYLKTEDPTNTMSVTRERAHARQGGFETAFITGNTKLGIGARQVDFKRLTFAAPEEKIMNLQLTQSIRNGRFLLEPTVGGTAVTRVGFKPMATLGMRLENKNDKKMEAAFLRLGYHNRFPSLLDRYTIYYVTGFAGPAYAAPNPELKVERVYSSELGVEAKHERVSTSLTGFGRFSKDARYYQNAVVNYVGPPTVTRSGQIINNGDAYTFGAIHSIDVEPTSFLSFGTRINWTKARFSDANEKFLYQPEWVGIGTIDFHDPRGIHGIQLIQKTASSFMAASEESSTKSALPGYYYMDIIARFQLNDAFTVSGGVENVWDRKIQFRKNQPSDGRFYVLSAAGRF